MRKKHSKATQAPTGKPEGAFLASKLGTNAKPDLAKNLKLLDACQAAIFIGDTHFGGYTAPLHPEGYKKLNGSVVMPTPLQNKLHDIWGTTTQEALESVKGKRFALILLGDLIEGHHHKNDKEIISVDENDHSQLAMKYLKPIADAAHNSGGEVLGIKGTPTHVGDRESGILEYLGGIKNPMSEEYAFDEAKVLIWGCKCNFKHHITTTMRAWTEASGLGIYMNNAHINEARNGEKLSQLLGRAHRHVPGLFSNGLQKIFVNPCYQEKTPYGHKVAGESRTQLGCSSAVWRVRGHIPFIEFFTRTVVSTEVEREAA